MTELKNIVKAFLEYFQHHPLRFDQQESVKRDGFFWCLDYWTLEVAKYLFLGKEDYIRFPIARRLWGNTLWHKNDIVTDGEKKLKTIEALKQIKDSADNLFIVEAGWGLDLLIACTVKKWHVKCLDSNKHVLSRVESFFATRVHSLQTIVSNSADYDYSQIDAPTIVIANNPHILLERLTGCKNENIKHIIWEGDLHVNE